MTAPKPQEKKKRFKFVSIQKGGYLSFNSGGSAPKPFRSQKEAERSVPICHRIFKLVEVKRKYWW